MQGAGVASSVVGAYASAQGQRGQASLDETNARLSELSAQSALLQGQHAVEASQLGTAQLKSAQKTSMAANGVDLGEGTPNRILTSTDVLGSVDAATLHANAVRTAFGYRTQEMNYQNQATARRAINPLMAGGSALLGGGAQVASSWYQLNKSGALNTGATGSLSDGWTTNPQAGP